MVATSVALSLLLALTGTPAASGSVPDPSVSAAQQTVTAGRYAHVAGTFLGGVAGGLAGAGVAYGVMRLTCSDWSGGGCAMATLLWAMPLGLLVGTPVGAWGGGTLLKGHGDFFPTLVGTAAGSVAALGLVVATQRWQPISWAAPLAFGLPLLGAMLGYQWSHASNLTRLQAMPLITRQGGGLAVAGTF